MPAEFAALLAAAAAALHAADGAGTWGAGGRRQVLGLLEQVASTLVVAKGKVVTAERDEGTWALRGDRDLAGFLGRVSHQGRGAGFAAAGQASTLAAMPAVAGALVDGPVTPKHVDEITRAAQASPRLAAELATEDGQARLVEMARRLDGAAFGKRLKAMSAALDPATRQREHDEQRANRGLHITHTPSGTRISGQMDAVAGHKFAKVIDALCPRPTQDDPRTRPMRQVDALETMVDRIAADEKLTPDAVAPVQALITFSEETWAALRGEHGGGTAAKGSAADLVAALRGVDPVTDENGMAWPASEVARSLCDCVLTAAVLDAKGEVLNLGRARRLFTKAQWLALYAGGQTTCAVDGCSIPLRFTELHHLAWWDRDGGSTDLDNVCPECSYHHHEVHRLDIRVRRRPDGSYEHTWPDGRPYGGTPADRWRSSEQDGALLPA